MTALDPRLNAYRNDLADVRLRGRVSARRYAEGRPARVIAGRAAVRRAPDSGASLDTFYHYGEPILVFEEAGNRAWCQSQDDGYVGYVERQQIELGAAAEPTDFLPRHSAVVIAETGILTRGTEYARLDTGGFAPRACFSAQPPRSLDIVTAAECYLGSPYLWGGKSFFGIDCSGLVQNAFRDLGISVLRDTDMQRDTIGEAVAIASEGDLRRGDLLYMPGHVVIYAGGGIIVHADGATMMVRRDKLADFLRDRRFDFGIFTVRRHPAAADN